MVKELNLERRDQGSSPQRGPKETQQSFQKGLQNDRQEKEHMSSETSSEPPDANLLEGQERYICVYTLEAKWTPCLNAPTPTVLNFAQPGWKAKRYAFNLKKFGPHLPSMRIIVLKFE